MDRRQTRRPRSSKAALAVSAIVWLVLAAGCSVSLPFARNEFGPALPKDASVDEVVARVNQNIERLRSWQSYDVVISGPTLPVHLTGYIAVERPNNFRLTASALGMDEADFGSNGERFWFWVKRGTPHGQPNYVFQARHEDVANSELLREIPFQPEWLMEAFGVIPIDSHDITLHPDESSHVVNLISERLSPAGQIVKKVIRVDTRRGVVLGHSVHDASGNLIAKARLDNHMVEKGGQIMPHLIALEWPKAGMKINLEIRHIDINPSSFSRRIWQVPNKQPYYPPFDIGAHARKRLPPLGARSTGPVPRDAGSPSAVYDSQRSSASESRPSPFAKAANAAPGRAALDSEGPLEWSTPIESTGAARDSAARESIGAGRDSIAHSQSNPFEDLAPSDGRPPRQSRPAAPASAANRDPFGFDEGPPGVQPAGDASGSPGSPIEVSPH